MGRDKPYAKLSAAAKEAVALDRMREPELACPRCETKTTAADLLGHLEKRCPGPREPHPQSQWVTQREAQRMGVARRSFYRWVSRGWIRSRGGERQYLLRDLVQRLASRRAR